MSLFKFLFCEITVAISKTSATSVSHLPWLASVLFPVTLPSSVAITPENLHFYTKIMALHDIALKIWGEIGFTGIIFKNDE